MLLDEDTKNLAFKITKENETLRLRLYRDNSIKKYLTIGVGRNLETVGIFEDEALLMQKNDIDRSCDLLSKTIPWFVDLSPPRKAVLIDMVFNMQNSFFDFGKMIDHLKNGEYDLAAQEILKSKYAIQVPRRAKRNSKIIEEGKYVSL